MPTLSAGDGGISIVAGIIIGLFASCVQSLGLTIQRKSHVLNQALPDDLQRVEHRRPLWLLGFLIFISSNILGSLFQIASLPVVILAPLGAVSLLWNAFFACFILGDVFSLWMISGTLLIAGGAVLIAIFGIVREPTHSLEDLLVLFARTTFIAYFTLLGVAVLVCLAITHLAEYSYSLRLRSSPSSRPSSPLLIPTNSTSDLTERTPLVDRKRKPMSSAASTVSVSSSATQKHVPPSRTPLLLSISYASTSGILSGMCLIFAKSGVELLLLSIRGDNQFWKWQAWMLLLGLVGFALLQLWYLHKALKLADPTIVCPLAFCFYNLSSIVNGLIYFDQISLLPTSHLLLVTLGIFILLGGVWAVSLQAVNVGTWSGGDDMDVSSIVDESSLPESNPTLAFPATEMPEGEHAPSHNIASEPAILSPPLSPRTTRLRLHHHHPRQSLSGIVVPVSPPPAPVPAPGFSIGLSPASPGFALVPRERRRCVSGQSGGDPWDEVIRRARTRRTASDGYAVAGDDAERGREVGAIGEDERDTGSKASKARGRWKWLQTLIRPGNRDQ